MLLFFPVEDVKRKVSVDVCKFVLYLYIQNVPHLSLKAPLMVGDEYPYKC